MTGSIIGNAIPGWNTNSAFMKFTLEGGLAIKLLNDTGANSVKGTVLCASTSVERAADICPADEEDAIGIMYDDGIADGEFVWAVIMGNADVLIQDSQTATVGYWIRTSITQAGRADITNAEPPGGGLPEHDEHFREMGHCQESKSAGTDVLARCTLHFN